MGRGSAVLGGVGRREGAALVNSRIGKMEESGKEEERRQGVPTLSGADGGEGEPRASPARPIYRPARPVSWWRDISHGRPYPSHGLVVDFVRSHRHGWRLPVRTPKLPLRLLRWLYTSETMALSLMHS